jgi:tRNA modification GTPase
MAADRTDTIAAIATPPGAGGIGVIRLSGPEVPRLAARLLGREPSPRHAHVARFTDADGELIDTGLLIHFPAPASFTGEHVLELQVHGSPPLLQRLLRRLAFLGVRAARAGEFSERAFLNGKLDLVQAEAIADLIAAGSEAAARAAQRSLQGEFSRRVEALVEATIELRVRVEAAIDFSDDAIDAISPEALSQGIAALLDRADALLAAARQGQRLTDGLHVVLIGRPNAGKSSLLNALAADERAIVTPQPGTTRDLLREVVRVDGVELTLVDTAGLRDSDDPIEQEGMRRARDEAARADLILNVLGDGEAFASDDRADGVDRIVIHNKIDLFGAPARREHVEGVEHLYLSARSGAGLNLLRDSLAARRLPGAEGGFSARARHVAALERARLELADAQLALARLGAPELAAEHLRQVQNALGEITGAFGAEDLLGRIFANFCIGK